MGYTSSQMFSAPPSPAAACQGDVYREADTRVEQFVSFHGFQLFVREQGSGHPLLLINGLGGNLEMWGPTQERLSRNARTIAFDAPGMGRSRTTPVVLPLPAISWMLCRLLDRLDYHRVDVVGYSLGGIMAQQLARSAPERLRRLVLVGTSCGWGSAPPQAAPLALISTPLRYLSKSFYRRTSHILDGGERFTRSELADAQAAARNSHPPSMIGYAQQFLQGSTWSSLHWAGNVSIPTLVIAGERDRLVPPANGMLLAARLPNSRLHVLPGEGHLMLFDPDSASLPLLEDFFGCQLLGASRAWSDGAVVEDSRAVERELKAAPGAQPFKAMSGIYRGWVRGPIAQRVFARRDGGGQASGRT
jgi:poly(3-hydroxyoctanoate) depolymerase